MAVHQADAQYSPEARDLIWTIPNAISLLRIISIPIFAVLVARREMAVALIVLAFSAFSDSLDGTLARKFNQVSKIGQVLDPVADRLLIFCSVVALGIAGVIPWWVLIVVGLRDLVMAIEVLVLAQHGYGPLPVHFVGKAGTAILMMSIPAFIIAELWAGRFTQGLHLICVAGMIWGVLLYWMAGLIYLKQGHDLLRADGVAAGDAVADGTAGERTA
ncbi:CDP-alcohol phosphatidyltransferase family protein [Bifidobacterium vespertilionis]|uniref:CDP-alcohol phosphatidyltransferase family protein n=1 Tax=Bifidobacterium vespertilionis TaxID=2562524 RepID=A0A5J5E0D2_9BIFI|nr:CDP-alcohol phosphatidyltransferase family protein [Bifidobacterium vespertilionis]KAA8822558.1 CDP-alcohol phosphatidyltransferase family protein [Bifidobacterium vespertilionis]KAA8824157.1 CDP-alcohol phosphatidyltransferase family protein [Bifidobacterium vespertilionis]MBT1178780.1 CDP-alcohol phosphatidyltransferase family protein [Bifidobacterium vespertilionis]